MTNDETGAEAESSAAGGIQETDTEDTTDFIKAVHPEGETFDDSETETPTLNEESELERYKREFRELSKGYKGLQKDISKKDQQLKTIQSKPQTPDYDPEYIEKANKIWETLQKMGLPKDHEGYQDVSVYLTVGNLNGAMKKLVRLKGSIGKESRESRYAELKDQAELRYLESEGLLKTDTAMGSGAGRSYQSIVADYANGKIDTATYKKYRDKYEKEN
jgi:hypothetical protein